jgi:hypothetical protein
MLHFGGYNAGPGWTIWYIGDYSNYPLGKTNYLGVAGYLGSGHGQPFPGIFVDVDPASMSEYPYWDPAAGGRAVSLTNVADNAGTSNTLMFGESTANAAGGNTYAWSWTATALPTAWGLPTTEAGLNGAPGCFTFSSRHRGVVNFVCADGSVRGIKSGFDPWGIEGDPGAYHNFIYASSWTTATAVDWTKLDF